MKIARIECSRHALQLDPAFSAAWDPVPRTRHVVDLVRVYAEDGQVGIGSGGEMPGFAGHEHLFVGEQALALERHARVIDDLSFHYGRCWPLDVALWDLAGKLRGQPCWRLAGACGHRIPVYASTGARRDPREMGAMAQRLRDQGFRAIKLRFWHEDWRDDLVACESVRRAVGDAMALMVDCNQAWRMPGDLAEPRRYAEALQLARALEALDVYWMEEPLYRGDLEGLRRLRDSTRLRIAGGEMTRELHELSRFVWDRVYDVIQPDAVLIGGLSRLREIARLAETRGLFFSPHTWGNGIGLLANAHLAAGAAHPPFLEWPLDPPEWSSARRDHGLAKPLAIDADGSFTLSDAPGLGLELDEDVLAASRL